jgi:hypothetical protein
MRDGSVSEVTGYRLHDRGAVSSRSNTLPIHPYFQTDSGAVNSIISSG